MDSSEKQNDKVGEIDEAEEIEDELKITDMVRTISPQEKKAIYNRRKHAVLCSNIITVN